MSSNQVQVGSIDLKSTENIVIDCPNCDLGITLNPNKRRHIPYRICPHCHSKIQVNTGVWSFSNTWRSVKDRIRRMRQSGRTGFANVRRDGKPIDIVTRPGPMGFPSFDVQERESRYDKKKGGIVE